MDILILAYAKDPAALARIVQRTIGGDNGFEMSRYLEAEPRPDARDHFGFADGIGQPTIRGLDAQSLRQMARTGQAVSLEPGESCLAITTSSEPLRRDLTIGVGTALIWYSGKWNSMSINSKIGSAGEQWRSRLGGPACCQSDRAMA